MRYGRKRLRTVSAAQDTNRYGLAIMPVIAGVSAGTGTRYGGAFMPSLLPYRIHLFPWMGTGTVEPGNKTPATTREPCRG